MSIPCSFDDLKKRDGPPLQAWGLYGDNELGRVNLITPEAVKRGRDSVQHGIAINLNLPLDTIPTITPSRGAFVHTMHVPFQAHRTDGKGCVFHGGMTIEEAADKSNPRFGTGNFAKHPITTRAHLLDIPVWLKKKGLPPLKPLSSETPIKLEWLKECAADYGIKFAPGDVLIVRSGFTEAFLNLSKEELANFNSLDGAAGVEATEDLMRWVWDQGFAAVAGDTVAFENWPPNWEQLSIHEVFIAGWGLPLGELFDLRELSATCGKLNKYSFLLTTMALNISSGIGTPVNGQAIL